MENKNSVGTLEENKENLLEVHDLWVEYRTSRGAVKAVNGLNLNIAMGETLGLVGETGAGKSTTAFGIMRILPDPPAKITGGEILYKGRDLLKLSAKEMRDVRGEEISMIFQDPMTSLDPVKTVGNQIQEMIELHTDISSKEAWTRGGYAGGGGYQARARQRLPPPVLRRHEAAGGHRHGPFLQSQVADRR